MSTEEKTNQTVQLSEDNLDTIRAYVGWLNVYGIIKYISAGFFIFLILTSFLTRNILASILALIFYGLFVSLYIWLGNKLKEASKNSKKLLAEEPTTEEDFKNISIKNMKFVAGYFRATGIISIIFLSFCVVIFAAALSQAISSSV